MTSRRLPDTGYIPPDFQITVRASGATALVSRWSPALERVLREHHVARVVITAWWTERGPGLRFLAGLADQVRHLVLADETAAGRAVISELRNLETLSIHGAVAGIDFARLPRLHACAVAGADSLGTLAASPSLRELSLERVAVGGLAELAPLGTLRALRLASLARVATLDGIEALALEELELARLTTPRSVAPVARLGALRVLSMSGARRLADLERVGDVGSLERLYIDRGPALASLAWMRGLARLRDVGFWRTRIRDGDLGVLLELPRLERVRALTPHLPHYSHTAEDLSALLRLVWPDTPMAAAEAERERRARALTAGGTSS